MKNPTSSFQSGSQSRSANSPDSKDASKGINVQYEQVESLDKVREILFGTQAKNFENQFQRLEDRINREAEEIKDNLKVRLDALESFVKKELEIISQQAKAEQVERLDLETKFSKEIKELQKLVGNKFSYVEEQSLKGHKELRQQILDQNKSLSNEIQNRNDSLKEALVQGNQELKDVKVSRVLLAELLMKLAVDLNDKVKVS